LVNVYLPRFGAVFRRILGMRARLRHADPDLSLLDEEFSEYLFGRKNPRGVHFQRWQHSFGCGKWFHVARCTVTLEVFGSYIAQTGAPPAELIAAIKAKRPDWEGFEA